MPQDLATLGAQYREARDAVAVHRRRQAAAELHWSRLMRARRPPAEADIGEARAAVDQAVADVRWCQAVVVAAGEAFKGCRFEDVHRPRETASEIRRRAMAAAEGHG